MNKRQETQAYKTYILNYNVMYHDYRMSDVAIEAQLGPEPVRFVDELESVVAAEFEDELEAIRDNDAWMYGHPGNGY